MRPSEHVREIVHRWQVESGVCIPEPCRFTLAILQYLDEESGFIDDKETISKREGK